MKNSKFKIAGALLLAGAVHGAQLQTYPQVGFIGANDLVPFSQNLGGGFFNSPVNITGLNFANSLATVGSYSGLALNLNNTWTGPNKWQASSIFNGGALFQSAGVTFTAPVTLPSVGAPNSILRVNPSFVLTTVTIGSNLNMDGFGVLSATFNVATNNISLPLPVTNGGTGSISPAAGLLNLGGASLTGNNSFVGFNSFANISDSSVATNQLLVLENLNGFNTLVAIGAAPGNGYILAATNTFPGFAWFPNPAGSTVTGNTTSTGWTNNTGVPCFAIFGANANAVIVVSDASGPWITNQFGGPMVYQIPVVAGGNYTLTAGSLFVGQYHSLLQ